MRQIIESLMVSITAREHRILRHDVPATASAYEHYLRGNQLAQTREFAHLARDMYLRCIEEDSLYAPAWARLGRCYRLLGKYADDPKENYAKATEAFRRALELNADLDEAHSQYAQLQADTGHAKEGMITLVRRAAEGSKAPELFVGLVYACRFCGLSTASVAADQEARRLDSKARTSITHTWFHMGDYPRALESSFGDIGYVDALALCMMGREAEAVELLKAREQRVTPHIVAHGYIRSLLACLENRREDSFREMQSLLACGSLGPEEMFYLVRQFARLGYSEEALAVLQIAVENGYYIYSTLARDSWLDSLRSDLRFTQIVRSAERHYREAMITFRDAGGERVFTSVALDV